MSDYKIRPDKSILGLKVFIEDLLFSLPVAIELKVHFF